jgi:LmbE family N-acetylglucosaminyl deacetylase
MRPVRDILAGFLDLPLVDPLTMLGGRRALILAPHPDDESIGCGGLIAAACAAGTPPVVLILTDGAASHPGSLTFPSARLRAVREAEALAATGILGLPAGNLRFLRQPDTGLAASGDVIETVLAIARDAPCGIVIGPWAGDPHCDHEAAAAIAHAVAIRAGLPLLSYPVWGWLRDGGALLDEERRHGWRIDISSVMDRKARAIAAHASQHGGLIKDSPTGFALGPDLLAIATRPFEVFVGP